MQVILWKTGYAKGRWHTTKLWIPELEMLLSHETRAQIWPMGERNMLVLFVG
jgi:hypothetical protein